MTFCVIWLLAGAVTKQTLQQARIGSRVLYGIPIVFGFYLLFGGDLPLSMLSLRIIPRAALVGELGVAVTVAGILLAVWARFHIGQNWSGTPTVKVGHELIRSGPYAWVRHPIYSGLLLAVIGTAAARGQVRGFVAVVMVWLAFWLKTRIEEKFMLQTFGNEYDEYRRSTGALVPRVRG